MMITKLSRIRLGLTQKQLGFKVGVSNVTIVKIEKGDIDNVKFGTLKKIAAALGSTVEALFLSDEA